MSWIEKANQEQKAQNEILSFVDYMKAFDKRAEKECRPTFAYIGDMLNYFGKEPSGKYKLFEMFHPDAAPVYGQARTEEIIFQNLLNFEEEGFNNKFLLLVGPNGSAKSSIVRKIMKGLEDYSTTDDGRLYTFSWVFPIDHFVKGSLGLNSQLPEQDLQSYAHLEDKDISAIMVSELKDHPILLIPKNQRQEIIDEALKANPKLLSSVRKSYLYKGDLSKRNRMVYDALLKSYKGNHKEVLKHVRVERFNISRRYSIGAVTIEPQLHVDAQIQQITMDKRLASLPPSLQCLNIFALNGEVILANRGILEYSDLLKRPMDTYKYLLMTMETGNINLQGILTELDIFFIGTSNEIHLDAFRQHPDYKSFKGRFNFIRVPYLLDYRSEMKIYDEQIDGLKHRATFEPHALKTLCLFAVMTRLRAPLGVNYTGEGKLGQIATGLGPLEKALLLADNITPDRLDMESKQILMQGLKEIISEFENDIVYEGKFGMSPRDLKKSLFKLTSNNDHITFADILEFLAKYINKRNDHDFLNMNPHEDYHNPARFVAILKEYALGIFDKELRDSLGLVDARSYEEFIRRYIQNINALVKGEKIKNEITGKFEEVDKFSIKEFENSIMLQEEATSFRSQLLSKLGAYFLDNPNKKIIYCDVFPDIVSRLQESFKEEQNKLIKIISDNLIFYEAEIGGTKDKNGKLVSTPLSEENRKLLKTVVNNLIHKHHYSEKGAIVCLNYLMKNRY